MDKLLTIQDVAEYLNISVDSVYKMAQKGKIPATKVANQWRFKRENIDKWLDDGMNIKSETNTEVN